MWRLRWRAKLSAILFSLFFLTHLMQFSKMNLDYHDYNNMSILVEDIGINDHVEGFNNENEGINDNGDQKRNIALENKHILLKILADVDNLKNSSSKRNANEQMDIKNKNNIEDAIRNRNNTGKVSSNNEIKKTKDLKEEKSNKNFNISQILENIKRNNKEQRIINEDLFGPITNETIIIVIQVHARIAYLRHQINSFSMAQNIHKALLIFSHDVWDEDINQLVRSIDFTMVVQIFYPLSLQTHPDTFPGDSSTDCARNATKNETERINCTNKEWADTYGHFREAKFTQIKHHWWWKANYIFDNLLVTSYFQGSVLLLEEDHYVSPDFLYMLDLVETERLKRNKTLDIICLGTYNSLQNYQTNTVTVEVTDWLASRHNMGMVLNRNIWNKILHCKDHFCKFDDYNWDWTLQHISQNCMLEKLQVMLIQTPRVFHIGDCLTVMDKQDSNSKKNFQVNGGWADKRDHAQCLNFTINNANQELNL